MKKFNFKIQSGFTFIELIVAIGIIVVIATIGFLNLYNFRSESELDLTVREIISVLRNAQDRSISQEDGVQWGGYFENPSVGDGYYLLYKGVTTTVVSKSVLRSSIQFLDPISNANKNVLFSSLSGLPIIDGIPNSSTIIKIVLKNDSSKVRVIFVNSNGQIGFASKQSNLWNSLSSIPSSTNGGALTAVGLDTIYVLIGTDSSEFWRYTISTGIWEKLLDVPGGVGIGIDGDLAAVDNNYVYVLRAADSGQDNFWRYNISTNNWTNLNDIPNNGLYYPIALTVTDNEIYANNGSNTNNFYKYSISTGNWMQLADSSTMYDGGDLTVVGNNEIYMTKGGNEQLFYKYTISINQWSAVANMPQPVYFGGGLTTIGTDIYAFRGAFTTDFWKYDILTNTWSSELSTLADVGVGGGLTAIESTIYALRGDNTQDFWKYK